MFEEPTPPLLAHWTWMMLNGTASTRMNLLEGAGGVSADGWTAEEMVRLRWSGACRWSQVPTAVAVAEDELDAREDSGTCGSVRFKTVLMVRPSQAD
jgi:hypothetical protein